MMDVLYYCSMSSGLRIRSWFLKNTPSIAMSDSTGAGFMHHAFVSIAMDNGNITAIPYYNGNCNGRSWSCVAAAVAAVETELATKIVPQGRIYVANNASTSSDRSVVVLVVLIVLMMLMLMLMAVVMAILK